MKQKLPIYFVLLTIIALVILFSFLRQTVDQTSFLIALDRILAVALSSFWELIQNPAIFISILVTIILLKYQSAILAIIPSLREVKYGSVSALFENSYTTPSRPFQDS